jgi:hypothetical protein
LIFASGSVETSIPAPNSETSQAGSSGVTSKLPQFLPGSLSCRKAQSIRISRAVFSPV